MKSTFIIRQKFEKLSYSCTIEFDVELNNTGDIQINIPEYLNSLDNAIMMACNLFHRFCLNDGSNSTGISIKNIDIYSKHDSNQMLVTYTVFKALCEALKRPSNLFELDSEGKIIFYPPAHY